MVKIIVRFHVVTGYDTVSSFYHIRIKTVWERVKKSPEAQELTFESHY